MRNIINIFRFIIENNTWTAVPKKIASAFYYQLHKRFCSIPKIKTLFNGYKIYLFHNNPVTTAFVYTDVPDRDEIEALRNLADGNTIFLDVGANVGTYSLLLKDKVANVYAFEAHPKTAELCRINFALNNIRVEQVLDYVVSDNEEPKQFTDLQEGNPMNSRAIHNEPGIIVPSMTLDAFIQKKGFKKETPFLIKIDVEGFEHEVFAGAKAFLSDYYVKGIVFENFSSYQQSIVDMLKGLGYKTTAIGKHNTLAVRNKD